MKPMSIETQRELVEAMEEARFELAALVPFPAIKGWEPTLPQHWMEALGASNIADAECLQKAWNAISPALAKARAEMGGGDG